MSTAFLCVHTRPYLFCVSSLCTLEHRPFTHQPSRHASIRTLSRRFLTPGARWGPVRTGAAISRTSSSGSEDKSQSPELGGELLTGQRHQQLCSKVVSSLQLVLTLLAAEPDGRTEPIPLLSMTCGEVRQRAVVPLPQ
jgi:hypothetical protein